MKRVLVCALLVCGCMTPDQRDQLKVMDDEIVKIRAELLQIATAQKAIEHERMLVAALSAEVEKLRTEVTQLEMPKGKKGKSPVFLR